MAKILDTRDLADRLDELSSLRSDLEHAQEELAEAEADLENVADATDEERAELEQAVEDAQNSVEGAELEFGDTEKAELKELEEIESEVGSFRDGETMIPEDEFTDYCREMLEDIGDLPKNLPAYIENNIDWDGVASDLKADYIEITYQDETYLVRSC
jgi:DNA repair exonuclease SbcCD ATPase subunit